jgi:hypothetical protein
MVLKNLSSQIKIRTSKIYQALLARLLEEHNHLEMRGDIDFPTQHRNKMPLSALEISFSV